MWLDGTMRSEMLLPHSWERWPKMSRSNRHYSHSQEKYYVAGVDQGRCSLSGCKMHWFLECISRCIFECEGFQPTCAVQPEQADEGSVPATWKREVKSIRPTCSRGWVGYLQSSLPRGIGPSASIFFQKLTVMITAKRGHTYQKVITWIRQRLTWSLLRSAISAIRATRFLPPPPPDPSMISTLTSPGSGWHWHKIQETIQCFC